VEDDVSMMHAAGFEEVRQVGATDFWTSKETRGVEFTAGKPNLYRVTNIAVRR
jgi:hypothetical protein